MAIYVHHNSQQLGPLTVAEVTSLLASGTLSPNDHVWWTGQDGWIPLDDSPVLQPGFRDPEDAPPNKAGAPAGLSSFSIAALAVGCLFLLSFLLGCYLYLHDQGEEVKAREEIVNSQPLVPAFPVKPTAPATTPAPVATPAPNPAPAPTATNLDQPIAPATANPGQ